MIRYLNTISILLLVLSAALIFIGGLPHLIFLMSLNSESLVFQSIYASPEAITGMIFAGFGFLAIIFSIALHIRKLLANNLLFESLDDKSQIINTLRALLVATAEGNISNVRKRTKKLGSSSVPNGLSCFISAKAAEVCGDFEGAIKHYKAMLLDRDYLSLAQRGLAEQYFTITDYSRALKYAKDAINKNKSSYWAYHIIFQCHVSRTEWSKALKTLAEVEQSKYFDFKAIYRYRAALLSAEVVKLGKLKKAEEAFHAASESYKYAPDFPPAVVNYSQLLIARKEFKKAAKVIKNSWKKNPHPVYAIIYRNLLKEGEIKNKEKYFTDLIKSNPKHYETQMFKAEQFLNSGNGDNALKLLSPYLSTDEVNARVCILAANAEALRQNNLEALEWLQTAVTAPKDFNWSDISPEGIAFDYTEEEWIRLINVFGKKAEFIHPRYEKGEKTLLPISVVNSPILNKKKVTNKKLKSLFKEGKHQEEKFEILIPNGLAERLESLLEPSKKTK